MLIALAAALFATQPVAITLNMSTQCGRAADYRDEKTLRTARKLVLDARKEGRAVRVTLAGGGTVIGYYGTDDGDVPYSIPVTWKTC